MNDVIGHIESVKRSGAGYRLSIDYQEHLKKYRSINGSQHDPVEPGMTGVVMGVDGLELVIETLHEGHAIASSTAPSLETRLGLHRVVLINPSARFRSIMEQAKHRQQPTK